MDPARQRAERYGFAEVESRDGSQSIEIRRYWSFLAGWYKEWQYPCIGSVRLEHFEIQVQGAACPRWCDLHHIRACELRPPAMPLGKHFRLFRHYHRLYL